MPWRQYHGSGSWDTRASLLRHRPWRECATIFQTGVWPPYPNTPSLNLSLTYPWKQGEKVFFNSHCWKLTPPPPPPKNKEKKILGGTDSKANKAEILYTYFSFQLMEWSGFTSQNRDQQKKRKISVPSLSWPETQAAHLLGTALQEPFCLPCPTPPSIIMSTDLHREEQPWQKEVRQMVTHTVYLKMRSPQVRQWRQKDPGSGACWEL